MVLPSILNMDAYIRDYETYVYETHVINDIEECKNILKQNKIQKFNIFHNNIRSLTKNFDELNIIRNEFGNNLDCIILTETFKIYDINLFHIPGYTTIYNNGDINKNDGVIIYIKNTINFTYNIINFQRIKVIQLFFNIDNTDVELLAIYRPPSLCPLQFNNSLQNFLQTNNQKSTITIIVGDINIDISGDSELAQEYLNILGEYGYLSTINSHTRVQGNTASCLDHIFIKTKLPYDNFLSAILKITITDHYPTILQITLPEKENHSINPNIKNHKKYINYKKLNLNLSNETWTDVYSCTDADMATNLFTKKLLNYIKDCTAIKQIRRNSIKRKSWMTEGLLKSIETKNKLYKNVERNPEDTNTLNEFRRYRNKLSNLIKATKNNFYKAEIENNQNSPKQLWKCIKSISTSKNKISIKSIETENGEKTTNTSEIANRFVNYFSNIGYTLAKNIKKPNKKFDKMRLVNSIVVNQTNEDEVKTTIKGLKVHKTPGLDNLTAET